MDEQLESEPDPTAQKAAEEELRAVGQLLSDFRAEVLDKIRTDVEQELAELEADGFDPARGRGRGPHWIKDG